MQTQTLLLMQTHSMIYLTIESHLLCGTNGLLLLFNLKGREQNETQIDFKRERERNKFTPLE